MIHRSALRMRDSILETCPLSWRFRRWGLRDPRGELESGECWLRVRFMAWIELPFWNFNNFKRVLFDFNVEHFCRLCGSLCLLHFI